MRVVFAWELGSFLGHLERDLPVAEKLREMGADVRFVVSNLITAEKVLAPAGFSFLPAPPLQRVERRPRSQLNFSELLSDNGYHDAASVSAAVRAWLELWRLLAPDVIVTDFAPTALLSARFARIRAVPIGPGFCVPLAGNPMPAFRREQNGETEALRAADGQLLAVLNGVATTFGQPQLDFVGQLFDNPAAQITSFTELDTFAPRNGAQYVGPISSKGRHQKVEWTTTRGKRVFAYLQSSMIGVENILAGLRQPGIETICVVPGARPAVVKRYLGEGHRMFNEPVDLATLLPDASAVVGYSSAGTVSAALQAGVPLLLFPTFLEQQLTAECVGRLGAALVYRGPPTREKAKAALNALLGSARYKNAAEKFAEKYRNYRHEPATESVTKSIMRDKSQ